MGVDRHHHLHHTMRLVLDRFRNWSLLPVLPPRTLASGTTHHHHHLPNPLLDQFRWRVIRKIFSTRILILLPITMQLQHEIIHIYIYICVCVWMFNLITLSICLIRQKIWSSPVIRINPLGIYINIMRLFNVR